MNRFKNTMFTLFRAKDEIRTRDPDLGKVVLYQLSYFRFLRSAKIGRLPFYTKDFLLFFDILVLQSFRRLEQKTFVLETRRLS